MERKKDDRKVDVFEQAAKAAAALSFTAFCLTAIWQSVLWLVRNFSIINLLT